MTLAHVSAAVLLFGTLIFLITTMNDMRAAGSSWSFLFGLLAASLTMGMFLFYILRGISFARGVVRWYWTEKTPPFNKGEDDLSIQDYVTISIAEYDRDKPQVDRIREEFLLNLAYGLIVFVIGLLLSLGIASAQSDLRQLMNDRSTLEAFTQGVSSFFNLPLGLFNLFGMPSEPLNIAVYFLSIVFPALFFIVAFANFTELLEHAFYSIYHRIFSREFTAIRVRFWILVLGALLSTGYLFTLVVEGL